MTAANGLLTVLVVDDNTVIRQGLRSILSFVDDVGEVLEAGDGQEAIEVARSARPDLVMLDVRMPVLDGLAALPELVGLAPVVMLTHSDDAASISTAMRAGARGYLVHGTFDEAALGSAVRVCSSGGTVLGAGVVELMLASPAAADAPAPPVQCGGPRFDLLTEREREIMGLIGRGLSNADIGGRLYLAEKTVKNHINRIYDKCGYRSRSEAIADWWGSSREG